MTADGYATFLHRTNRGRVVYDRKPNWFTARDVERILMQWIRRTEPSFTLDWLQRAIPPVYNVYFDHWHEPLIASMSAVELAANLLVQVRTRMIADEQLASDVAAWLLGRMDLINVFRGWATP